MRIIRGKHGGRRLNVPKGLPVRPTTDLAKESLFNILENHVYFDELEVLDLYAGTGSISYEFASRDCKQVISVDIHPKCIRFMDETVSLLGLDQMKTVRSSAIGFLNHYRGKFDLVFADPPYDLEGLEQVIQLVFERSLLNDEGWLVIEHSQDKEFSTLPNFVEKRSYGSVNFSFFQKK
jgi:16S rRNA (guanine(966)-N(2))-methyltransferase RsmD